MPQSAFEHNPTLSTPGSPTATSVVRWTDSTTLVSSGVLIDNSDNMTVPGYLYLSGDEKALRFYNGSNHVTVKASSSLGGDIVLTLPTTDGDADQFLQTNGSGVLTWAAAGASDKSAKRMLSAPQEIASGWSDYSVTWGTNVFDTGSYASESNTAFKASTANGTTGKHIVTVSIRWEANSTGDRVVYIQHLLANGSTGDGVIAKVNGPSCDNSGSETEQTITALADLADGEFVRVRVSQQSGGGLDVSNSISQFSIIKIA